MELLFFSGVDPKGHYRECSYGGADLELCFEVLTTLVNAGWQLLAVELKSCPGTTTQLPVAAFDGASITEPLNLLQQEWEAVLQLT